MPETELKLHHLEEGQQRMEKALSAMADSLSQLIELRVSSDSLKLEVMKLRDSSHSQANALQIQGQQILEHGKMIETLFKKCDALSENEKNLEVKQAKNGVIISFVTGVIVVALSTVTKGAFH